MTNAKRLLILLASINMLNYIDRYIVPAVLVQMSGELHLSGAQSGSLMSVFFIVYMLTSPLFGYLGDRYSRPKLVAFGIALWSLATAGAAMAVGYKSLIITRGLVGIGEAAYVTLGPAMLSDVYAEKDRARVFTWFYLAIPVGSALGYALGGFMGSHWGWRSAFLIAGIPGLIFAWRMGLRQDPPRGAMDESPDPGKDLSYLRRLKLIFTNRIWLAATVSYIGYTFAMGGLSTWSPALMQLRYHLTESDAGMIFGALAVITGILGTFAGGKLTDLLQKRWHDAGLWISGLTLLMAVPVVYLGVNAATKNAAVALYFAGMLLLFVNTSPVNTIIVSSVPASLRSSGVALNVLLIHFLGDALSPYWVGYRMDVFEKQGIIKGEALSGALEIVLPALVIGGIALWWARHRKTETDTRS
jgi:MFS transporter, Spinster family, sphingosine-1-phosphate transporter